MTTQITTQREPLPVIEHITLPNAVAIIAQEGVNLPPFEFTKFLSRVSLARRRTMHAQRPELSDDELDFDAIDFLDDVLNHAAAIINATQLSVQGRA